MKKIIGLLSLFAIISIMACNDDKPVETKKEVIIVKEPPAKEKATTVTVDKNGVKVEAKKVDVTVKK